MQSLRETRSETRKNSHNPEITVEVDFLAGEYGGTSKKHRTQIVQDMHPRKARACDLAFLNPIQITIEGTLPEGGKDRASIQVASIVPFLSSKVEIWISRSIPCR